MPDRHGAANWAPNYRWIADALEEVRVFVKFKAGLTRMNPAGLRTVSSWQKAWCCRISSAIEEGKNGCAYEKKRTGGDHKFQI